MSTFLRVPRIIASFLAIALGTVSLAAAVNAKVNRDDDHHSVEDRAAQLNLVTVIDDDNIVNATYAMGAGSILLILVGLVNLFSALKPTQKLSSPTHFLISTIVAAASAIWLLVCSIYLTVVARNSQPTTTAYTATGTQLPQSIVDAQARANGIDPKYWRKMYIRFIAISPWFSFLAAVIATAVFLTAWKQSKNHATTRKTHGSDSSVEKGTV